ncbi:MAG TPA: DUF5916 domain-containing protein [Gemmatimonadota bacterium]|nr:DUF5916 domain-containing protein [Gemmatimonadota bacterium]
MSRRARTLVLALMAPLAWPVVARPQTPDDPPPASAIESTGVIPASPDSFQPLLRPTLEVRRAAGPIELDGELDDAGWQGAARTDDFSETFPKERGRPPVESEVWVTYDDRNLYVAFLARDDPSTIRATLTDRDNMWSDDYFGILLDTYGDAQWAYFLFANPLGVQGDSRFASAIGEDDAIDLVYETEGRITPEGYQIEMAIPFESLRFPDRPEQAWRVTFWRTRPRGSRATYSWAAMSREEACFLCQYGTLTGIRGVEPGVAMEFLPYAVASQAAELRDADDPASGIGDGNSEADVGMDVRYAHPSGLTVEGTLNPDFSQVESDVAQIDVNETFALFFPERRPFFQEGSDLFDTWIQAVYTRQINDPDLAGKLLGRFGETTVAYLGAYDQTTPLLLPFEERSFVGQAGRSVSNILRYRRSLGAGSHVGALVTDRRLEGNDGAGSTYGADLLWKLGPRWQVEGQLLGSHTVEPDDPTLTPELGDLRFDRGDHTAVYDGETFSGHAAYASLERAAERWSLNFDYWTSSPTFRADNGFETRNDFHYLVLFNEWNWYPEATWIDRFGFDFDLEGTWNYDGIFKQGLYTPTVEFQLAGQNFVEVGYEWTPERFSGIEFDDLRNWWLYFDSDFSERLRGGFFLQRGREIARFTDPASVGEGTGLELWATIRPWERLVIEPGLDYSELHDQDTGEELFSGYVLRTRTNFHFTRELFLRLVLQWDDFDGQFNVEPLLTYRINPFTLFFVGSTQVFRDFEDPRRDDLVHTSRQLFAKLQVLFRR